MSRVGHEDRLCHWMQLDVWIGMALHDIFAGGLEATDSDGSSNIYLRIIGAEARDRIRKVREPIAVAVRTSSLIAPEVQGVERRIARILELLVGIWLLPNSLEENPTHEWLWSYLTDPEENGLYTAWSKVDKVWSIYSFFCWAQTSDLNTALSKLADTAGLRSKEELEYVEEFRQSLLPHASHHN
jgi:hypothetical protein